MEQKHLNQARIGCSLLGCAVFALVSAEPLAQESKEPESQAVLQSDVIEEIRDGTGLVLGYRYSDGRIHKTARGWLTDEERAEVDKGIDWIAIDERGAIHVAPDAPVLIPRVYVRFQDTTQFFVLQARLLRKCKDLMWPYLNPELSMHELLHGSGDVDMLCTRVPPRRHMVNTSKGVYGEDESLLSAVKSVSMTDHMMHTLYGEGPAHTPSA